MSRPRGITHGIESCTTMLGDYQITETLHASDTRLSRHDHEDPSISIVLRGGFLECIGSRELRGSPGTLVVKPAGAHHADRYAASPTVTILIHRPLASFHGMGPTARAFGEVRLVAGAKMVTLAMALQRHLRAPGRAAPDMEIALEEVLLELAGRTPARRPSWGAAPWLRRVRDQLIEGAARPISISAVADQEGVSLSAVSKAFRQVYGLTPGQLVRSVRIERARHMLQDATKSLSHIAHATGFADQAHFTRSFKREMAVTPGQYRRHMSA